MKNLYQEWRFYPHFLLLFSMKVCIYTDFQLGFTINKHVILILELHAHFQGSISRGVSWPPWLWEIQKLSHRNALKSIFMEKFGQYSVLWPDFKKACGSPAHFTYFSSYIRRSPAPSSIGTPTNNHLVAAYQQTYHPHSRIACSLHLFFQLH